MRPQFVKTALDYLEPVSKNCCQGNRARKANREDFIRYCHDAICVLQALIPRDFNGIIQEAYEICEHCDSKKARVLKFYKEIRKHQKHI